jgi:hypothetical protein
MTQSSLQDTQKYQLITKIQELSLEKRLTSFARRKYKTQNNSLNSPSYHRYFWNSDKDREQLRRKIRVYHLVLNFLKGTPYKKVESKVGNDKKLSAWHCNKIHSVIEEYFPGKKTSQDIVNWVLRDGK